MGLKGFTTFVDDNSELLLTHVNISDTKIIIDGSNLMYFIYRVFRYNSRFGGDYNEYRQTVDYFFQNLKTCKITPIIVMDGCQNIDNSKLNTSIKRHDQKLKLCYYSVHNKRMCDQQTPIPLLLKQEFRASLKRNSVINISSNFEADDDIVKMANHFHCPLLSNDSDFFVYDLASGLILLDYMDLNIFKKNKTCTHLRGAIYKSSALKQHFPNLDPKLLALGGTLHDNDYMSFRELDLMFKFLKNPKKEEVPFSRGKSFKTARIFKWLNKIGNYGDALNRVLDRLSGNRNTMREKIDKCVLRYLDAKFPPDFDLNEDLSNYNELLSTDSALLDFMPEWMVKRLTSNELDVCVLDALISNRIFLPMQVENFTVESSHNVSLPIRQIIYGILMNFKKSNGSDVNEDYRVIEYDRVGKNQRKSRIEPNYLEYLNLSEVQSMDLDSKRQFFGKVLHSPSFDNKMVDKDIEGVFNCILYWARESKSNVSELHIWAVFICIIRYFYVARDMKTYAESLQRLEKYEKNPKLSPSNPLHVEIVHSFAQLQSCYFVTSWLNDILDRPFLNIEPSRIISGSFLYNIFLDLTRHSGPLSMIRHLLERSPDLHDVFFNLTKAFSSSAIELPKYQLIKKKRSKKKLKKTSTVDLNSDSSETTTDEDSQSNGAECLMGNKFRALSLDFDLD